MTRHERRLMWQERVDQYRASGMSVAAWCRENEVSEQQMYYWLRKFRSEETDAVEDDIQWIQLGLQKDPPWTTPYSSNGDRS